MISGIVDWMTRFIAPVFVLEGVRLIVAEEITEARILGIFLTIMFLPKAVFSWWRPVRKNMPPGS